METRNSHFAPASNVTQPSSLITQTITKSINHIRKSFNNKYQVRLRKVSKKKAHTGIINIWYVFVE